MSLPRYVVGIDLGTTHCVVSYADAQGYAAPEPTDDDTVREAVERPKIEVFPLPQLVAAGEVGGRPLLPSARYHGAPGELSEADTQGPFNDPEEEVEPRPVLGAWSLALGAKVPGRLVTSAKSWLSHDAVDRTAPILPWGAPSDVPKISPVVASASYLRHIRYAWDSARPKHPLDKQEVVLTVPASFDEGARALTLQAAELAGLPKLRLVEEPQAAFYDWLDRHRGQLESALPDQRLALVVDVGGGTTDLTLIQIEWREQGPRLTRIAVGDHLMLGGDNMDLALARHIEQRISGGSQLGTARFSQLVQQCRKAKELLLAHDAPESTKLTVLGSGSKLVGGARSTELTRDEVLSWVRDGFLPLTSISDRPEKRRGALVEFGLPYVADAAITRHVAEFLARHEKLAREALGDRAPAEGEQPLPDAVLLNGGVFRGRALSDRILETLAAWRGEAPIELENTEPELAVARGAVAYALARRGLGLRIGGGSARSYYLHAGQNEDGNAQGVCLLSRGAEEGEDIHLTSRTFSLRLGRPVRFKLASSTQDVHHHAPGDLIEIEGEAYQALPPLAAVLEAKGDQQEITVELITALTEVGTLEMSCVAKDSPSERWKLEFQLRGGGADQSGAQHVTQLHPRFETGTALVRDVFGQSKQGVEPRQVKTLRRELEKALGARDGWDTALLRELFNALLAGAKRRRRSEEHERIWFNLTGYCLRPGFGYPLDEWRVSQLSELIGQGVQFAPKAQNWSEWWTMWRRVAGGLNEEAQTRLIDEVQWYIHPPTRRPRKRPDGPKKQGYDDMVRLLGALERVAVERKVQLGDWLVERLMKHDENGQSFWAVGRLGARVPFYGSAHYVVPRANAMKWLEAALSADWKAMPMAGFAAAMLARMSGDRDRDLPEEVREQVKTRLAEIDAPAAWQTMVTEVLHLEQADEQRIFGESLPPGLRLLE